MIREFAVVAGGNRLCRPRGEAPTRFGSVLPESARRVPCLTVLLESAKQAELGQAVAAAIRGQSHPGPVLGSRA